MDQAQLEEYCAALGDKERIAMKVAQEQLGSTFCLKSSNGAVEWLKMHKTENTEKTPSAPVVINAKPQRLTCIIRRKPITENPAVS